MSRILMQNVNVFYPVMQDHYMSIRRAALRRLTGGKLYGQDAETKVVHAIKDFSIDLRDGDRIGLIGRNGAGKSTLLKTISSFILPDNGEIEIDGTITSLFSVNGGLDVERTGYDNIYVMGRLLGLSRKQMDSHMADIEEFSELGKFLNMPVRSYSDGMRVRLGVSVVTCINPDILLLDEALGTGDAHFIEKTTQRAQRLYDRANIVILASHAHEILQRLCNKAIWLDKGRIVQFGPLEEVLKAYTTETVYKQSA